MRLSTLLRTPAHVSVIEQTPRAVPALAPLKPAGNEIELAREVIHFRAHLGEAFDTAREWLIERFARELLGRELQLAPVDITQIVESVLQAFSREEPLRIRLNPQDAANLRAEIPALHDPLLLPGDAIVEVRNGTLDARLAIRFECLLLAASAL